MTTAAETIDCESGTTDRRSPYGVGQLASVAILVAVVAAIALLPRLLSGRLRHWDEAWYAQVSREMADSGQLLTPHWNYAPWFHKPPLAFWATAGSYRLVGESETSARLFSYACGVLSAALLAAWTTRVAGAACGTLAGLLLLSVPHFDRYVAQGQLDGPLTLWITLALCGFWIGRESPRWHLLSGAALGLAILTKGAAAGLAVLIQLAYMAFAADWRPLRQRHWYAGAAVALAVAAPWHVHQIVTHGDAFVSAYFSRHLSQFFVHIYPEVDYRPAGPFYYFAFLADVKRPHGWAVLALMTLGGWISLRSRDRRMIFFWCWTAVPVVAMSFARTKWHWYLTPVYPGAAALAAILLLDRFRMSPRRLIWVAAVFVGFAALQPFWLSANDEYEEQIARIAPEVQRLVPSGVPIHTLQTARASQSVYPIATLYYCERPVKVAHGIDHFLEIGRRSEAMFYALIHVTHWERIADSAPTSDKRWFHAEIVEQNGPVMLVRIVPGYLAEQIYPQYSNAPNVGP